MEGFPQYLGEDYNSQLPCWLSKNANFERRFVIPAAMGAAASYME
jgi:hypothetical protein